MRVLPSAHLVPKKTLAILRPLLILTLAANAFACQKTRELADSLLFGITDNAGRAPAGVTVTAVNGAYFVSEFHGTIDLSVALNSRPTSDVTFTVASTNTNEMTPSVASMTFTPDNWDVPQTITITGVDEYVVDGNKDVPLSYGSVVSTDFMYSGIAIPSTTITVLDNETYGVVVSPPTLTTTESGTLGTAANTAVFYVGISLQPTANVVIPTVTVGNTAEGSVDRSSLTFTPANWNVPQAVTVTGLPDGVADGNKNYTISLGTITSSDTGYNGLTPQSVSVTNLDMNAPILVTPISIDIVEATAGECSAQTWGPCSATFSISNTCGAASIPVSFKNSDGSDASSRVTMSPAANPIVFTGTGSKTITISTVDDSTAYKTPVTVVLGTIASGGCSGVDPADVTVNIDDNDGAGIRVSNMTRMTEENSPPAYTGALNATFKVVLTSSPAAGTTVTIPVNDLYDINNYGHKEGYVDKTILTFDSTNWSAPQTVTVTPVDDYIQDGNVSYVIGLEKVSSTDPNFNGIDPRNVTVTNKDHDAAKIVVTVNGTEQAPITTNTNYFGAAVDDAGQMVSTYATYAIRLYSKPTANVVVNLTNNGSARSTLSPTSLTFTPSNWNQNQTFTVTGKTDGGNATGDRNYTITTAYSTSDAQYTALGKPTFYYAACDNDGAHHTWYCYKSASTSTAVNGDLDVTTSEAGATARFWLIAQSSCSATVNLSTSLPTEGTVATPVTITASNFNTLVSGGTNEVVVTGVDDAILDPNHSYSLNFDSIAGCSNDTMASLTLTNADNEQKFWTRTIGNTTEGGGTGQVCLYLGADPGASASVPVSVTCSDATECNGLDTSSLTFTAAGSGNEQCVTVTGKDDLIADGNQTITVAFTVGSVTGGNGTYNSGDTTSRGITNVDDENAAKAVWVTNNTHNGEFTASPITTLDSYCRDTADTNYPTALGARTYYALIVNGNSSSTTTGRIATTSGTDATGQYNWWLRPSTQYYLFSGGSGGIGDVTNTRIFDTDTNKLIVAASWTGIALPAVNFWTGFSSSNDMRTANTAETGGAQANCYDWTYTNDQVSPFNDYFGTYGAGGSPGISSLRQGTANCRTSSLHILCAEY